jgi:hypothetical protein
MSIKQLTETGVEISLSMKGFRKLPRNVYENDFPLIVGENRYYSPSFLASLLTPQICDLQKKEPTLRESCIETKDPTNVFEKLVEVCRGSNFRVS